MSSCSPASAAADAGRRRPVIAITGTNGKSTTTALVGTYCCSRRLRRPDRRQYRHVGARTVAAAPEHDLCAGNVRPIQIDLAPSLDAGRRVFCSTSRPIISTATAAWRITPRSRSGCAPGSSATASAVIGVDDDLCRAIFTRSHRARGAGAFGRLGRQGAGPRRLRVDGALYRRPRMGPRRHDHGPARHRILPGAHNWQNAACGLARRSPSRLEPPPSQRRAATFPGLAHRMEDVGHIGKVLFVNDSKATNADAAARALAVLSRYLLDRRRQAEGRRHQRLAASFPRIRKAYLIGEAAHAFAGRPRRQGALRDVGHVSIRRSSGPPGMPRRRPSMAPVVLLSPACASFDQFRDFEQRGDKFRELVRALPGVAPP